TTCPTAETCVTNRYPCTPYTCDPATDTCRTSCAFDGQCGQGATCDTATGKCASMGAGCQNDFTIVDTNGQLESCIPYKCGGGGCHQKYRDRKKCFIGYACANPHGGEIWRGADREKDEPAWSCGWATAGRAGVPIIAAGTMGSLAAAHDATGQPRL